ncbi:MAG TPA: GDSL-type esterase/lipase family protein, partial [Chloroflexaceae bacterium]|nr:GDSL-type esterase/lipase family protein [Chloroflexaceae bacterium]
PEASAGSHAGPPSPSPEAGTGDPTWSPALGAAIPQQSLEALLGVHLAATARDGAATLVAPPEASLRAPRLAVAGWPGPAHTLRQGDALLVEGQDYLAHWDVATGILYAQVLAGLPPGGDAARRTFSFLQQTTPGLSLGVQGRTLSPDGLLQVDGNMPDANGNDSAYDLFYIPYIQATPEITLTGVFQGPGAGVEFVLDGVSRKVFGAAGSTLAAGFSLPAFGEYRADGYIINAAGARLGAAPDDTIAPLALGRIVLTIGDSITAGQFGDEVRSDSPSYPITTAGRSPAVSQDGRNFYQYNNSNNNGAAAFRRGYQLTLNNLLTACADAPVFILNEGFDGLTLTADRFNRPPARPNDRSALAKIAAYRDHIEQLGARHVLIMLGSNDVRDGRAVSWFRSDLRALVVGLWGGGYGLNLWLAPVPWTTFPGVKPEDLPDRRTRILDYNREIVRLATAFNSGVRPVRLGPDFYTHFERNPGLLADGLHPTQAGYEAMAQLWAAPSGVGVAGLPCRAFAEEGRAPPPPLNLTTQAWLPQLTTMRMR